MPSSPNMSASDFTPTIKDLPPIKLRGHERRPLPTEEDAVNAIWTASGMGEEAPASPPAKWKGAGGYEYEYEPDKRRIAVRGGGQADGATTYASEGDAAYKAIMAELETQPGKGPPGAAPTAEPAEAASEVPDIAAMAKDLKERLPPEQLAAIRMLAKPELAAALGE